MKNFLKIGLCLTLAFIIASCENPTNEKPTLIDTTLEAITIKTNPTKTTYQVNEEFDPTGLVITATYTETYSNASTKTTTKDVTYNNGNMTFSGTDFSTVGTKTITVTYSEKGTTKTATLQVTVNQDETPRTENVIITYAFVDDPSKYEGDDEFILYCRSKATALLGDLSTATDVKINIPTGEVDTQFLYELYTEAKKQNNDVSVEFENPQNTTIGNYWWVTPAIDTTKDKDADKYSNIRNFVELITPESQESPKLSVLLDFYSTDSVNEVNLYHTGIDKLLQKSYNLGMSDDIELINGSLCFDAVDHLTEKGGIAYNEDGSYANNYYDLDVNAALLMGVSLKNVNITGSVSGDKNTFEGIFTNVRFAENTSGFTFSDTAHGVGLIEFAGDSPSVLPMIDKAKLVISNLDNVSEIGLRGGGAIDFSRVSALDYENGIAINCSGNTFYGEACFKNETAYDNFRKNGGSLSEDSRVYYTENNEKAIYGTNQQWVEAGNSGEFTSFPTSSDRCYPSSVSNLQ